MNYNCFNVAIVDDEKLVRELVMERVDWEGLGCQVVLQASSALEVLDYIDEYPLDIVLADINMPVIDGITLAGKIKAYSPRTRVVMLTGYDDFSYAKRSIENGVDGYLLKPVRGQMIRDEIIRVLEGVKKELDAMKSNAVKGKSDPYLCVKYARACKKSSIGIVEKVQMYIDESYCDPDISLKATASFFYVNPDYLSRIFKKQVGLSFKAYVFKKRMERAVEMMKNTDLRSYQIGEAVGIIDPNYFSACFKKYMSVSISEYKRNMSSGGSEGPQAVS